jgi:hypothetical protein
MLNQYITEGFGFLAIKLVPGQTVNAMKPIRIAYDGSSPVLPLRMIAAGTGANVGLELFVLGAGRWETKNFPATEVPTADLVWDFAAMGGSSSNFRALETAIFAREPRSWITETSDDFDLQPLTAGLPPGTTTDESGHTTFSKQTDETELRVAFPGRLQVTISRLLANLPSFALATDLELQASLGGKIPAERMAPKSINFSCPSVVYVGNCDGFLGCSTSPQSGDPSSTGGGSSAPTWLGMGLLGALGFGAAKRRTRHA